MFSRWNLHNYQQIGNRLNRWSNNIPPSLLPSLTWIQKISYKSENRVYFSLMKQIRDTFAVSLEMIKYTGLPLARYRSSTQHGRVFFKAQLWKNFLKFLKHNKKRATFLHERIADDLSRVLAHRKIFIVH